MNGFNEAYIERSANGTARSLFTAFNASGANHAWQYYNVSTASNDPLWGPVGGNPPTRVVPVAAGYQTWGDSWATTSGSTGYEYISGILQNQSNNNFCIGIGTASISQLSSGAWLRPMECVNLVDADLDDGPSIHFDSGAPNLWVVDHELVAAGDTCGLGSGSNNVCLYTWQNCSGPSPWPNSATCPARWMGTIASSIQLHAVVAVNPITHNGIIAYRDSLDQIVLQFRTINGVFVHSYVVKQNSDWGAPTDCNGVGCNPVLPGHGYVPKCGGCGADCSDPLVGAGCAKVTSKVQVVTKYDAVTQKAYAYVSFDELSNLIAPDGQRHFKSYLYIVDVTNELNPFFVNGWISTSLAQASDQFGATVAVLENYSGASGNAIQLNWYSQPLLAGAPNRCGTVYMAATGVSFNPSTIYPAQISNTSFPTMRVVTTAGMGDYTGAVQRGIGGDRFYATWAQPIETTAACVQCGGVGSDYDMAVVGARVHQ